MSFTYIAGIIVGIVIIVSVAIITKFFLKKTGLIKKECYDERQMIEKGKGYRLGFFVGNAYFIILMILQLAEIEINNAFWSFVGVCLSVGVFAIYCIIKNAYFGYNQPPKGVNILLFVLMIINLIPCITAVIEKEVLKTTGINLVCSVLLLSVIVASLIKNYINKKDSDK